MSHITRLSIKNYRGIKDLTHEFGNEKFIVLIGRGDSGKSTILSAIYAVLSPSWNMTFSDLDFHDQNTTTPIEIEATLKELPNELLTESKYGLYIQNDLNEDCQQEDLSIIVKLTVDETLEPHWVVKAREGLDNDDKPISGADRALIAVNFITDYTDNQFAYNRQSPLYALTKTKLAENKTIERVKSELIRSMASSASEKDLLQPLNAPLEELKRTAEKLGLNVTDLCAQLDIKENPYTGNSISLHNDSLPYCLHGKGSKRLMSIAIQSEMTKQGGIVLNDEIEQGLEPDRITTLVRILKNTKHGQVFITTHNSNVVTECDCRNLFVRLHDSTTLLNVSMDLYACHRYNPNVFFAKRIILCEGDTEQGFLQSIDSWLLNNKFINFSSLGIVIANVGGGANMYVYALRLNELGYKTCIFADNDKPQELKPKKDECEEKGIVSFLCEEGNCMEKQLLKDLSWSGISNIIQCDQKSFPKIHVIPSKFKEHIEKASNQDQQQKIRNDIANRAITDKWFKHIQGGEFIGNVFIQDWNNIQENHISKTIVALLNWCNIAYD